MLAAQLKQQIEDTLLPEIVATTSGANEFRSWRLSSFYEVGTTRFCNGILSCVGGYPDYLNIGYFFAVEIKRRNSSTLKLVRKKLQETIIRVIRDHPVMVHDVATCVDPECMC